MSERDIVRVIQRDDGTVLRIMPDGSLHPITGCTDWDALAAMTEEEIEANARSDPDNPPLTEEELARMRRVPNPREIRRRLHLTQEEFSARFRLPLGTIRDWEQGKKTPDSAARVLLRVIEHDPEAVLAALAKEPAGAAGGG